MGDFRIVVNAAGGHGCDRDIKDGGLVYGCGRMSCPDCRAREFVEVLKRHGVDVKSAELTHWPGEPSEVVDDLLTKRRKGSFS